MKIQKGKKTHRPEVLEQGQHQKEVENNNNNNNNNENKTDHTKSQRKMLKNHHQGGLELSMIQDERFQMANTLPQFRKKFLPPKTRDNGFNIDIDDNRRNRQAENPKDTGSHQRLDGGNAKQKGNVMMEQNKIDERFASMFTDPNFSITGEDIVRVGNGRTKSTKKKTQSTVPDGRKNKKEADRKKSNDEDSIAIASSDPDSEKKETAKDTKNIQKSHLPTLRNDTNYDSHHHDTTSESDTMDDENDSIENKYPKRTDKLGDSDDDDIPQDPESRIAYLTALSRGEISCSSSSDDDDTEKDHDTSSASSESASDDDDDDNDEIGIKDSSIGILDPSYSSKINPPIDHVTQLTYESSPFLAICNMDWTVVRAVDLFVIMNSFAPSGTLRSIRIYPSDFGMDRMKQEEKEGPKGIWKEGPQEDGQDNDLDRDKVHRSSMHPGSEDEFDSTSNSEEDDYEDDDDNSSHKEVNEDDSGEARSEVQKDEEDGSHNEVDEDDFVEDDEEEETSVGRKKILTETPLESDFDPEKLRAYEASKLKYYFAIAEFTSSEAADSAYKELDGIELGHSSAVMDLRSIPREDLSRVVHGREVRDEATSIPSKYTLPDFVVSALQQTSVKCTWDEGDRERERLLTAYSSRKDMWQKMEDDDLRAYLASDASSDEDDDDRSQVVSEKQKKSTNLRNLLSLDQNSDDEDDNDVVNNDDNDSFFKHDEDSDQDNSGKEVTFVPGTSRKTLEERIRKKLEDHKVSHDGQSRQELTPWEQYQLKRKEKRKEKKKEAKERKEEFRKGSRGLTLEDRKEEADEDENEPISTRNPSSAEELNLILAGDNDEEDRKDFDMRGLLRIEKNKTKKLKGSRKRKEMALAENVAGTDFKINVSDNRFAAVVEGNDDRFGIDVTNPHYKETPAMRELLAEQTKRRNEKQKRQKLAAVHSTNADSIGESQTSSGGLVLSSLVKSLKNKLTNK